MSSSRSIDVAKTASIDMMALNNKVVNMRQVVKRSKIQMINKLTRHISKLKRKKGSDEQKQQNLHKAERLIEEIDTIRKLKPDKVSKYAIANTSSFNDVSKMSIAAGPRALARLAEHPLITKVVSEFRQQHSDWKDLSAYLLIKQTGRRFKTKKQKKLAHSVENINASETMTKAYIQSRFGKEGLMKAEQNFAQKRNRKKGRTKESELGSGRCEKVSATQLNLQNDDTDEMGKDAIKVSNQQEEHIKTDTKIHESDSKTAKAHTKDYYEETTDIGDNNDKEKYKGQHEEESNSEESDNGSEGSVKNSDGNDDLIDSSRILKSNGGKMTIVSSKNSGSEKEEESENITEQKEKLNENTETVASTTLSRKECVVKEFSLDSGALNDDEHSNSSSIDSEDETNDSKFLSKTKGQKRLTEGDETEEKFSKKKSKKEKSVPDFLLERGPGSLAEKTNNPFFAESDDDDDDGNFIDSDPDVQDLVGDDDYYNSNDRRKGNMQSMFYNPLARDNGKQESYSKCQKFDNSRRGRWRGDLHRGRGNRGRSSFGPRGEGYRSRGKCFRGRVEGHKGGSRDGVQSSWDGSQSFKGGRNFGEKSDSWDSAKNRTGSNKTESSSKNSTFYEKPKEKLHPSWEASKKRKAEQSGLVTFQGSKITFDDD